MVERFRNGDPDNDPTVDDIKMADPGVAPEGWRTTSWTHDWYEQEEWARQTDHDFYYTVQSRRYGGDLQGVIDKLDYLEGLGVTVIYFNPLNDAPSLHKYDARHYRHIDRNFGPDPIGDRRIMERETPSDPATWEWTTADRLFLDLVGKLHSRGMRAVMDYSWNHTGVSFWAWQDVLRNQRDSEFAAWYDIETFDDRDTPEDEFSYTGWAGVQSLPNFRKVGVPVDYHGGPEEGDLNHGARAHVFEVTRRWLDPDGDGDPSDGVDGFRLDVAEQVPLGFWRDYRAFVKSINPDAFLVGEIWWERWPDKMMDPRPYLGDVFDAVMNYRWYRAARSLVSGAPPALSPTEFVSHMVSLEEGIPVDRLRSMMNVAATHDTPRLSTSLYNAGRYKYGVNPRDNPHYHVDRPDERADRVKRMLLVQQFTYHGAPHIWYGDEVGMWGADDPDCRKPMVWDDLAYAPEVFTPDGKRPEPDLVRPDTAMLRFYRELSSMRSTHAGPLALGGLEYVLADDNDGVLAYERVLGEETVMVVFNFSGDERLVEIPGVSRLRTVLSSGESAGRLSPQGLLIPASTALVLASE